MEKKVKSGSVELAFNEETDELVDCVIRFPENNMLIAAEPIDTITLAQALRHIFDGGSWYGSTVYLLEEARRKGSSWEHLMELAGSSERFWLCCGPLSSYVPTKKMREVYQDLLDAAEAAGRPELYRFQELYPRSSSRLEKTEAAKPQAREEQRPDPDPNAEAPEALKPPCAKTHRHHNTPRDKTTTVH